MCTCSPSAHCGRYFFTIYRARRDLLCILFGGPHQTLLMVKIKYHPQCALAVQVHSVEGICLPSIVHGEVLFCILLGGPHQTLLMVTINTIHSVHLQSKNCGRYYFLQFKLFLHFLHYTILFLRGVVPSLFWAFYVFVENGSVAVI